MAKRRQPGSNWGLNMSGDPGFLASLLIRCTGRDPAHFRSGSESSRMAAAGAIVVFVALFEGAAVAYTAAETFGASTRVAGVIAVLFAIYVYTLELSFIADTGVTADARTGEAQRTANRFPWARAAMIFFVSLVTAHAGVQLLVRPDLATQAAMDRAEAVASFDAEGPLAGRLRALEDERESLRLAVSNANSAVEQANSTARRAAEDLNDELKTGAGVRARAKQAEVDRANAASAAEAARRDAENRTSLDRIGAIEAELARVHGDFSTAVAKTEGPITEFETLWRLGERRPAAYMFWLALTAAALAISLSGIVLAKRASRGARADEREALSTAVEAHADAVDSAVRLKALEAARQARFESHAASYGANGTPPRHDEPDRRRRLLGASAAAVAVCVAAAGLFAVSDRDAGSSSSAVNASAGQAGKTDQDSKGVTVDVDPVTPISVELPGVATVTGRAGSVTTPGKMTVEPISPKGLSMPSGAIAAGRGIEVSFTGTQLAAPLDLAFTPTAAAADGMIPVVAHSSADGRWEIEAAALDRGRIMQSASTFSIRLPAWLDPAAWLRSIGDRLASLIAGRTSPEQCANNAPDWGSAMNQTMTVHLCVIANPDSSGAVRYEVRLKSNRPAWLEVTVPDGADYVWVDEVPDAQRAVLAGLSGAPASRLAFLPPGGMLTMGFRRPPSDVTRIIGVRNTNVTQLFTMVGHMMEIVGALRPAPSYMKNGAALALLGKCSLNLSGVGFGLNDVPDLLRCVFGDAAKSLANPEVALAGARNLLGPSVDRATLEQQTALLTHAGGKLATFGWVTGVLAVWPAVRSALNPLADGLTELFTNGLGTTVTVNLTAARAPATTTTTTEPKATTPGPTTTTTTTTPRPPVTATATAPNGGGSPGTTTTTTRPVVATTTTTTMVPRRTATAVIHDDFLGGTWARSSPDDGTWYRSDRRPPNGVRWLANGTSVTVDCTARRAAYRVYGLGAGTWYWWIRMADGTWSPVAATQWAQPVTVDSPYPGVDTC
jgi:hypothetical protein